MIGVVEKWGNSLALRIPGAVAKDTHLRQGSVVEVAAIEGGMIIKPKGQCKLSLSHMLKGITKNNRHSGQNCSDAVGREVF